MGENPELYGTAFETGWGWCAVTRNGGGEVVQLLLPTKREKAEQFIKNLQWKKFPAVEKAVRDYFKGVRADFSGIRLCMDGMPDFHRKVYKQLLKVPYGKRVTYKELARMAGNPNASRAVGGAMRRNPIPLIIPCHRVIRSDGATGQFSADGGPAFKRRMLEMESPRDSRSNLN